MTLTEDLELTLPVFPFIKSTHLLPNLKDPGLCKFKPCLVLYYKWKAT